MLTLQYSVFSLSNWLCLIQLAMTEKCKDEINLKGFQQSRACQRKTAGASLFFPMKGTLVSWLWEDVLITGKLEPDFHPDIVQFKPNFQKICKRKCICVVFSSFHTHLMFSSCHFSFLQYAHRCDRFLLVFQGALQTSPVQIHCWRIGLLTKQEFNEATQ